MPVYVNLLIKAPTNTSYCIKRTWNTIQLEHQQLSKRRPKVSPEDADGDASSRAGAGRVPSRTCQLWLSAGACEAAASGRAGLCAAISEHDIVCPGTHWPQCPVPDIWENPTESL